MFVVDRLLDLGPLSWLLLGLSSILLFHLVIPIMTWDFKRHASNASLAWDKACS